MSKSRPNRGDIFFAALMTNARSFAAEAAGFRPCFVGGRSAPAGFGVGFRAASAPLSRSPNHGPKPKSVSAAKRAVAFCQKNAYIFLTIDFR
jgi:hypothetical protein